MANLCISTPSQAGIISFSTPNSSFILDRRRRSIILCAVLRAILRPAAEVADGGLRCRGLGVAVVMVVVLLVGANAETEGAGGASVDCGFICIIFRARLGGGGSSSGFFVVPDNVRFLCRLGEIGGDLLLTAAGGREKLPSIIFSCADGSAEADGVSGALGRGIVVSMNQLNKRKTVT